MAALNQAGDKREKVEQIHMQIITPAASIPSSPSGWVVLERYGIPTFILVILIWGLYKLFWPTLLKQIEFGQQVLEKQIAAAQAKDERHEARFDRQSAEFVRAIEAQGQLTAKAFTDLHNRLDRDRDRLEGKK